MLYCGGRIRRRICVDFPSEYWRDLDKRDAYPTAFVQAMTASGFLAALMI